LYRFKWPARGTVQIIDHDARLLFSATGSIIMEKDHGYHQLFTIGSHRIYFDVNREQGNYTIRVGRGKKMGDWFTRKFAFLVVNRVLLYEHSDYDTIEDENEKRRETVIKQTQ